jgi:hypothetical protein
MLTCDSRRQCSEYLFYCCTESFWLSRYRLCYLNIWTVKENAYVVPQIMQVSGAQFLKIKNHCVDLFSTVQVTTVSVWSLVDYCFSNCSVSTSSDTSWLMSGLVLWYQTVHDSDGKVATVSSLLTRFDALCRPRLSSCCEMLTSRYRCVYFKETSYSGKPNCILRYLLLCLWLF